MPAEDNMFQEYSVQLTFREQWLDERLKFNNLGGKYAGLDSTCVFNSLLIKLVTGLVLNT